MKQPKYFLEVSIDEYRLMIYALIQFRNKLIQQDRYPDAVNDLLIKLQKPRRHKHGWPSPRRTVAWR